MKKTTKGSRKKSSFFSGRDTERGGGVKAWSLKKNTPFETVGKVVVFDKLVAIFGKNMAVVVQNLCEELIFVSIRFREGKPQKRTFIEALKKISPKKIWLLSSRGAN